MTTLRPYQVKAVDQLISRTVAGVSRTILQMPTGSGKTAVFCHLLKSCFSRGKRGMMVVKGAKLVHQASERLTRENVPHGLFQAGNTKGTEKRMQVCSIDTLFARKIAPDADFIVIDEAHLTQGGSYKWLLSQKKYEKAIILGVTATPFAADGLAHVATEIIRPVTIQDLITDKFLVGGKYYVPYIPDLSGVKSSKSDYISKHLEAALKEESSVIYGKLQEAWNRYGRGRRSLVFCCSVAHAKDVQREMQSFGANVAHIDASIKLKERDDTIALLEAGKLDGITSVGCLTTGVDIPSLDTIFMLRPTKSYNLWIQMLGRGTRPFPGKPFFTLVDLSGNLYKHGPIETELCGQIEPTKGEAPTPKNYTCEACFNTITIDFCDHRFGPFVCCYADHDHEHRLCPACGNDMCDQFAKGSPPSRGIPEGEDAEIKEYTIQEWERRLPILLDIARKRGFRKGWILKQIEMKFGKEISDQAFLRVRSLRKWPLRGALESTTKSASKQSTPSMRWESQESGATTPGH